MRSRKKMMVVATLVVTIGLTTLWFSPAVNTVNHIQSNNITYARLKPEMMNTIKNYGMISVTNNSFPLLRVV